MGGKGQKGSGNGLPRNNKNRPAGSGTTSHARRERVRAAAQARDKAKEEEEKAKKEEQRVKDEEEKKMMDKKKEENQNMKDKKKEEDKQVSLDKREIVEDKKAPLDKREAAEDKKISLDKRESAKELGPSDTQKEKDTWADMLKRKKEWQPKSAAAAASTASNFPPLPKGSTPAKAPCQKEEPAASDKKETPCQKESTQKSSSSSSSESVSCDWGGSSSNKSSTASNPKKKNKVDDTSSGKEPEEEPKEPAILVPKLPEWVAVDWYQTIESKNGDIDRRSLEELRKAGCKIWVVSWCGYEREKQVRQKLRPLQDEDLVQEVSFTREQTGVGGKAEILKRYNVWTIFDDNGHICKECQQQGMNVYPIGYRKGRWYFNSLLDAVCDFLYKHGK